MQERNPLGALNEIKCTSKLAGHRAGFFNCTRMFVMTEPFLEFETPEDLKDVLEKIGLKLHAINRIAGEESKVLWYIAETIRATGRMVLNLEGEPQKEGLVEVLDSEGAISKKDELDGFLARLKEEIG